MTGSSSERGAERITDLLARYGELAAGLEDTDDPSCTRELETELADLDARIDRLLARRRARTG